MQYVFYARLFRRVSQIKTLKLADKIETLLCAAAGTASHQHGLRGCTVRSGSAGFMTSVQSALLEECMKEKQCSVICFLVGKDNKPIKIHCCLKLKYGKVCLSLQQVYKWGTNFKQCLVSHATQSGQAHNIVNTAANCRGRMHH
jgi:hypothetical protein